MRWPAGTESTWDWNQVLPVPTTPPPPPRTSADFLAEFNQLVHDIMADGVMTTPEFLIVMDWLRDCPHTDVEPIRRLKEAVERVSARDGQVTAQEQEQLEKAFRYYLETGKAPPRPDEEHTQSVPVTEESSPASAHEPTSHLGPLSIRCGEGGPASAGTGAEDSAQSSPSRSQ